MAGIGVHSPHRFGRYILIDRLGKGGMAEVFRAIMPGVEGFRQDLVIKQIRPDQSRARNFIEMFVHEARISAQLHHPNIVQVFDFGQVDGCYFLAMELLRGRDLLAVMKALRERRRPFPIPIAIHIAQQVAVGLGYAHALQTPDGRPLDILHRDVSPSNIMCLATGGVKLLDFGIASAIGEGDSSEAEESTFKGKLSYLAPERLGLGGNGSEPKLDGRIDLFSLGTVLWEVLAGRRLFQGKTDADKLRAVLERPIPAPSSLRGDIPARLDEIVLKALERDRDKRYLTGQALADDLEELAIDTKYQSRMLPMLMQDLFGVGGSRSHLAISALPPDFLTPTPLWSGSATAAVMPSATMPARAAEEPVASAGLSPGAEAVPASVLGNFSAAEMSGPPTPLPPVRQAHTPVEEREPPAAGDVVLGLTTRRRLWTPRRLAAAAGALGVLVLTGLGLAGALSGARPMAGAHGRPAGAIPIVAFGLPSRAEGPTATGSTPWAVPGAREIAPAQLVRAPDSTHVPAAMDAPTSPARPGTTTRPTTPTGHAPPSASTPRSSGRAPAAFDASPRPVGKHGAAAGAPPAKGSPAALARTGAPSFPHPGSSKTAAAIRSDGRVEKGLSIDPFAEAAARLHAHTPQ